MLETWQLPTLAQEIGPTSRFPRALRHDLPEFVTLYSVRRGTRVI
jgi:hypothetical protein